MPFVTLDDGTRLAYRVDGAEGAPTLVLVNSLGSDIRMWEPGVAELGCYFRVVRYDTRGHGRSDAPPGPYSIERLGRDLLELLDHLQMARAHVCGVSLGGLTVQWIAAHHPERVERAVLANTAARIGTETGWEARIEAVRAGGMAAVREAVVARFLCAGFRARRPDIARAIGDMLEATSPAGYIGACAALRDADLGAIVSSIRVPTLIVAGEADEATPPSRAEELHAAIAESALVVLPGAGHLSNVEQPSAFNQCLLAFLAHNQAAAFEPPTEGER
jgi:3-oxoadipate enol-lactonase